MNDKRNLIIGTLAVVAIAAVGYFRSQQTKAQRIDITPDNPQVETIQSQEEDTRVLHPLL